MLSEPATEAETSWNNELPFLFREKKTDLGIYSDQLLFTKSTQTSFEAAISAYLTRFLQLRMSRKSNFVWMHQAPTFKNDSADILLSGVDSSGRPFYLFCFEVGTDEATLNKADQLEAYIINIIRSSFPVNHSYSVLGGALCISGSAVSLEVTGFVGKNEQTAKCIKFPVFKSVSARSIVSVLASFEQAVQLYGKNLLQTYGGSSLTISPLNSETTLFVSVDSDRKKVYKIFYRVSHSRSVSSSGAALYKKFLNGDVVMSRSIHPVAVYVAYDYVEGAHTLLNSLQAKQVIQQLIQLLDSNLVHGDIRLYNVIFGAAQSTLIDFDLSGTANIDCYPRGYNREIPDGDRHSEACGGERMQHAHDWFGMATIFAFFEPCLTDLKPIWGSITEDIRNGDFKSSLENLESQGVFALKQSVSLDKGIKFGTGTPPQELKNLTRPYSPGDSPASPPSKQARLD